MSYTEIFIVKKNRVLELYAEVPRAHMGAEAIWKKLEQKYLPSLPMDYDYLCLQEQLNPGEKPYKSRTLSTYTMKDIWDLQKSPKVSDNEKIMLLTTFDEVYTEYGFLSKVIEIYENIGTEQMKKQAAVFRKIYQNEKKIIGVYVNQTSAGCWWDQMDSCKNGYYKLPHRFIGVRELFEYNKSR